MRTFNCFIAFSVFLIITTLALGKPDRQPVKPKENAPVIKLPIGLTNWGTLSQLGNVLSITGHPLWDAEGLIRPDGKVELIWTLKADGHPCPSVYEVKDGHLYGQWGYARDGVYIDENGKLAGQYLHPDHVFKVEPAPEPIR